MSAPGQNNVDFDALLDLSDYDNVSNYNTPSRSPSTASKQAFASPVTAAVTTPSFPSSSTQSLSGPSHNYDMYRQQTGFVPGALANTMAVNQTNNTGYQDFGSLDYISGFENDPAFFDFNTSPSQNNLNAPEMDMDFDSPVDSQHFLNTVNPNNIEHDSSSLQSPPVLPTQTGNVGRLWPGAHSQAAMAKAQQQQRQQQQQQLMQQQQQQQQMPTQNNAPQPTSNGKAKARQQSDPLVEQKITQLLNSMRAKGASLDDQDESSHASVSRIKKDEDEMDEDERLLASEEGRKLTSKERRQLRNKVSARAFRSRRKEYISQLESQIATQVSENKQLKTENARFLEENKRLTDLTRMLLASPSFSNFLDHLSSNPSALPQQNAQVKVEGQQQQPIPEVVKDSNPYGQQSSQHQIGMAMIPEQNVDFSMMNMAGNDSFNFQPQVFVVDTPEIPAPIDASVLSGKTSNFVAETFEPDNEKMDLPDLERPAETTESEAVAPVDEAFESDPDFALFHSQPATTCQTKDESDVEAVTTSDIFGGIESDKVLARLELVNATEEESAAALAMARVQHISANMEPLVSRLERLTMEL